MRKIVIHAPIFSSNSIGIADKKITEDLVVEIDYTNRHGDRPYPHPFYLDKSEALKYPIKIQKGTALRIIPIPDMVELNEKSLALFDKYIGGHCECKST